MNKTKQFKIVLIGDSCVDVYRYGTVDRISPEAPVPVFVPQKTEKKPGMAANVHQNLKALGLEVITYFGKNSEKIRLIDTRSKQHIVRIDNDTESETIKLPDNWQAGADAIVISDYNKGSVSYELIEFITKNTKLPVFIDTKKTDLKRLGKCYIKINEYEWNRKTSTHKNVIVTLGGAGAMYQDIKYPAESVEVVDVCGAGDTFLSSLTYQFLNTGDIVEAIKFAIKAATITVQHTGNYAPKLKEII